MHQSRRSFLRAVAGSAIGLTVAGCSTDPTQTADSTPDSPAVGGISVPNPVITQTESPIPTVGETSGEGDRYTSEIVNSGAAGEVTVELYWAEEPMHKDNVKRSELEFVAAETLTVEAANKSTVVFSESRPDEFKGHYFFVSPVTVTAYIKNTGGQGDVVVTLFSNGETVDSKTVKMGAGSEEAVELRNGIVSGETAFSVQAKPVDD